MLLRKLIGIYNITYEIKTEHNMRNFELVFLNHKLSLCFNSLKLDMDKFF